MANYGSLFTALGLPAASPRQVQRLAESVGIPADRLRFYDDHQKLPVGEPLQRILRYGGLSERELSLRMGVLDRDLLEVLRENAAEIVRILPPDLAQDVPATDRLEPVFRTELGELHQGDCLDLMAQLPDESVDVVFADPPFNLDKLYPSGIDDNLRERAYLDWCELWLTECIRILTWGGNLFLWNLPKWNGILSHFLSDRLTFRHWIATDIKYSLPIGGRLYPSHYSLLYFCKGERPRVFHPDRLPMEICPHCYEDLRDYGGYKSKMNPSGVSLTDVWFDISPVRHSRFKRREGANELPIKLVDRVLTMASDEGDLIVDPFGGAGTTYAVAEMRGRRWIGIEIGPVDDIVERLSDLTEEAERLSRIREGYNRLFTLDSEQERESRGLWTDKSLRASNGSVATPESDAIEEQKELPLV